MDRLARLLWDADRPVQVVFAGKAHPADRPGQRVIQEIFTRSRSPELRGRVFIVEDYDMRIARFLVHGRRRLAEQPAPAARGERDVGHEGGPERRRQRCRVLDGWWDEGWTGDNGWAIGGRETNPDEGAQDWADAQDLYRILEDEVVPRYYQRDETGVPRGWTELMRNADRQHDLAVLDDADAPRVHRAAVPARRPGRRSPRPRRGADAEPIVTEAG